MYIYMQALIPILIKKEIKMKQRKQIKKTECAETCNVCKL